MLEEPEATAEAPLETTPAAPEPNAPGGTRSRGTSTPQTLRPPASESPSAMPTPGARTFAWVPVANASGYHVELYRGGSRIFATNTSRPEAPIPASWTFNGRRYGFEPAEYRWYVWPIVSGKRAGKAVVQARLVVPAS